MKPSKVLTPLLMASTAIAIDQAEYVSLLNQINLPQATASAHPDIVAHEGEGVWVLDLNVPENLEKYSKCPPFLYDEVPNPDERHLENVKNSGGVWYENVADYADGALVRTMEDDKQSEKVEMTEEELQKDREKTLKMLSDAYGWKKDEV